MLFDERMILHRYKATSHAAMAGAGATGFLYFRSYVKGLGFRKDLFFILCAMALTKVAFMAYYRFKD